MYVIPLRSKDTSVAAGSVILNCLLRVTPVVSAVILPTLHTTSIVISVLGVKVYEAVGLLRTMVFCKETVRVPTRSRFVVENVTTAELESAMANPSVV